MANVAPIPPEWLVVAMIIARNVTLFYGDGDTGKSLLALMLACFANHLREVVEGIVASGEIRIGAIGIGYRTHGLYPALGYVEAPEELGSALISRLEQMLIG